MSRVFLAVETALGRNVVVKVLLPELAAGVNIERFRREIQLAAQLQHPHIVPLLTAGEAGTLPYFIMPFVAGESLRARVAREGELPVSESVRILRDIASALAYAHARGVVHRDVKPDNVLLSGGVAVVTDFGVAKAVSASSDPHSSGITSLGVALGTPMYMAPEQATASPQIDHRADLYALGTVAYEILTGLPPFAGRTPQAVLAAQVVEDPQPVERRRPAVPPTLATLVNECLAKRPADRPQSAAEVMQVLDAVATPSGGTAPTVAVRVTGAPTAHSRHGPLYASLIGAAAAIVVIGAALVLRPRDRASVPPPTPPGAADPAAGPAPVTPEAPSPAAVAPAPPDTQVVAATPAPPAGRKRQAPAQRPAVRDSQQAVARAAPLGPVVEPERFHPDSAASLTVDTTSHIRLPETADNAPRTDTLPPVARPRAPVVSAPPPAAAPAARPSPRPPPSPAPNARPGIERAIADYAAALEAQNVDALRGVYPAMTPEQSRGWQQFFGVVRDVRARLSISRLELSDTAAEAQVTGTYTYLNTSTQRGETQPVSFIATLRRDGDRWRIRRIR
jgi:serine/threonine-protein kinase